MKLVITKVGFDYMVELKPALKGSQFVPPVKQLFGGVNPNDAYTDKGYTDLTIEKAALEWARSHKISVGRTIKEIVRC